MLVAYEFPREVAEPTLLDLEITDEEICEVPSGVTLSGLLGKLVVRVLE